jgi:hypothetical protein
MLGALQPKIHKAWIASNFVICEPTTGWLCFIIWLPERIPTNAVRAIWLVDDDIQELTSKSIFSPNRQQNHLQLPIIHSDQNFGHIF